MKSVLVALFAFSFMSQANAELAKVNCQVFDGEGNAVSRMVSIGSTSRIPYVLKVTDTDILYIRWTFINSPVRISVTKNPYYPFVPLNLDERAKLEISSSEPSETALDSIAPGYVLSCYRK